MCITKFIFPHTIVEHPSHHLTSQVLATHMQLGLTLTIGTLQHIVVIVEFFIFATKQLQVTIGYYGGIWVQHV